VASRESLCDWLMSRYGSQVRAIADMTAADEREYGFALSGEPGALDTTGMAGDEVWSRSLGSPVARLCMR